MNVDIVVTKYSDAGSNPAGSISKCAIKKELTIVVSSFLIAHLLERNAITMKKILITLLIVLLLIPLSISANAKTTKLPSYYSNYGIQYVKCI